MDKAATKKLEGEITAAVCNISLRRLILIPHAKTAHISKQAPTVTISNRKVRNYF